MGSRTHSKQRVLYLPEVSELVRFLRAMPRITTMARTMPTAAETKVVIGETRHLGQIAHRGFPLYACQFVLVVNEGQRYQMPDGLEVANFCG